MGGAVVQKYIGEYSDKLKGAILFAPATAGGMNRWKTIGDTMTKKNLRISALKSFGFTIKDEDMAVSAFFDGRIKSMEDIKRYNALLQKESAWITICDLYKKYTDNDSVSIPVSVIGSKADSYFPEESLKKTAEFYHTEPVILDELCHDMMLDPDWKKAAEAVLKFLEDNQ